MVHSVRRGLVVWWVPVSIGCTSGPTDPLDTGLPRPTLDTQVNDTLEQHCAATGEKPVFDVQSTVSGRVDVHHLGYELPNCGVFQVYMERKTPLHVILEYGRIEDTAEECPETCIWSFTYQIAAGDGDWTFELRPTGEQRMVTVQ
jgi:hypothetical protein